MPENIHLWVTNSSRDPIHPGYLRNIRSDPVRTERDLIERAITFANRGTIASWCNFRSSTQVTDDENGPTNIRDIREDRRNLRSALLSIVNSNVSPERVAAWCRIASGVLPLPTFQFKDGAIRE